MTAPGIKDQVEQVTTIAGLIALMSPVLAIVIRWTSFALTPAIQGSPRLAATLPATELALIGTLAAIPLIVSIAVGLFGWYRGGMTAVVPIVILAVIFIVLAPGFPGTALQLLLASFGVWVASVAAEKNASVRSLILPALAMAILAGFTYGFSYRGELAAQYTFDHDKVGAVGDGPYSSIAVDGDFAYLLSCATNRTVVAVPTGAIKTIVVPPRSLDLTPSLLQIVQGASAELGLRSNCP